MVPTLRPRDEVPAGTGPDRIAAVTEMLLAGYRTYFPGAQTSPRIAGLRVVRRRLSDIARVDLDLGDSAAAVYVKIHKRAGQSSEYIRHKMVTDFQTLSLLDGALDREAGHAVPTPIAMFPDHLAVVTRAAEGQPLHRLIRAGAPLWKGPAHTARLQDACRRVGRWLREFQAVTLQPGHRPFSVARIRERLGADLDVCVGLGLPGREAVRIGAFCAEQFARYDGHPLPVCGVHPDFQPDNVLVSRRRVTALDFSGFRYGPPFGDVARFLASVDFFARNPVYRSTCLRHLMTAFMAGYEGGPADASPLLGVSFVRFLVRSTASVKSWSFGLPLYGSLARRLAVGFLSAWEERLEGMLRAVGPPTDPLAALRRQPAAPDTVDTTIPDSSSGGQGR